MNSDLPLVTAIACCYNHQRFVAECLQSIEQQQYPNLQVIVTDDCSQDDSRSIIRAWIADHQSLRVTFVENGRNQGLCKTVNHALTLVQGKYICPIATDDAWEPGKIHEQVKLMESLPEKTGVVYSDAHLMDEHGVRLGKRFIETYRSFQLPAEGDIHDLLWEGNFIPAMTTMIRRSVFEAVGNYDESLFYEDWDMWLRVSQRYHFAYFPRPTARYRVLSTSMSKASVDRMRASDELMFVKNLLHGQVPERQKTKAFNYAIRSAYRQKTASPVESKQRLAAIVRRYKSPRLLYGWMLYRCGFDYRLYEKSLELVKRLRFGVR